MKKLILFICFFVIAGCASNVNKNGAPLPKRVIENLRIQVESNSKNKKILNNIDLLSIGENIAAGSSLTEMLVALDAIPNQTPQEIKEVSDIEVIMAEMFKYKAMYIIDKPDNNYDEIIFDHMASAADKNNAYAQNSIAWMYNFGIGVRQNSEKGLEYLLKSAKNNNYYAQHSLAIHYLKGDLVKMDLNKYLYWMNLSCENGYKTACTNYDMNYRLIKSAYLNRKK